MEYDVEEDDDHHDHSIDDDDDDDDGGQFAGGCLRLLCCDAPVWHTAPQCNEDHHDHDHDYDDYDHDHDSQLFGIQHCQHSVHCSVDLRIF